MEQAIPVILICINLAVFSFTAKTRGVQSGGVEDFRKKSSPCRFLLRISWRISWHEALPSQDEALEIPHPCPWDAPYPGCHSGRIISYGTLILGAAPY